MNWIHLADNRNGKTFGMALLAWEAYNLGRTVYCNCRTDVNGNILHILNFPHQHYEFEELRQMELFNCYLMSDESVEFLDAFEAPKKEMREISYFANQAKKRNVDFHVDAVRLKNIYNRIRLNWDFMLESFRYPRNIKQPVLALRFELTPRYGKAIRFSIRQPLLDKFFKLYNHLAAVRPPEN